MTRYHVGSDGSPKPCNAQPGNCPLGGAHSENKEKIVAFAEGMNELADERERLERETAKVVKAMRTLDKGTPAWEYNYMKFGKNYEEYMGLIDREEILAIESMYDDKVKQYVSPDEAGYKASVETYFFRGPDQSKFTIDEDGEVQGLYIYTPGENGEPLRVDYLDENENMYVTDDGQRFPASTTYDADSNTLHVPDYGYAYGGFELLAVVKKEDSPPPPCFLEGDSGSYFPVDDQGFQDFSEALKGTVMDDMDKDSSYFNMNGERWSFASREEVVGLGETPIRMIDGARDSKPPATSKRFEATLEFIDLIDPKSKK